MSFLHEIWPQQTTNQVKAWGQKQSHWEVKGENIHCDKATSLIYFIWLLFSPFKPLVGMNQCYIHVHVPRQLSHMTLPVFFILHSDNKMFIVHSSSPLNSFFLNHCHYRCSLMISDVYAYVSFSPSFYVPWIFCAVFSFLSDWNPHGFHLNRFHLLWTLQVTPLAVLFWKIKISNWACDSAPCSVTWH